MAEETQKTDPTNEHMIRDIGERVKELTGFCNVLYSAVTNEGEPPEESHLSDSIYLLVENLETLQENVYTYIKYCEDSGLFGELISLKEFDTKD